MATTYTTQEVQYLTFTLGQYIELIQKTKKLSIKHLDNLYFRMATTKVTSFDANDSAFFALLVTEMHTDPRTNNWAFELIQKLQGEAA